MINILIPMSGENLYETSSDFIYPKILTEVANKTLLEYSQLIFDNLRDEKNLIYIAPEDKLNTLGLKSIIQTITDGKGKIVALQGQTKGAVCSCLMAIDDLSLDDELIISSADHYIDDNLQRIVNDFRAMDADAGVLTFESVHPKWSFVTLNEHGAVVQAAEKKAISRTAVAGLYYFKKARDFVEAAMNLIRKDGDINGNFYLSSCLNELVLLGKVIKCRPLQDAIYHNFYDAHAVKSFELAQTSLSNSVKQLTNSYIEAFNSKDIEECLFLFSDDAVLVEPNKTFTGKDEIKELLNDIFVNNSKLQFRADNIIADDSKSAIKFTLELTNEIVHGVDFIEWNSAGKIHKLTAFLND
ncbi:nuclear transport factor 2 family protein [Enterobacter roggenkampii]|uniref:nuclear transport factor 2 family protein n=1 Tax=Enterobacter roggenkampii TaxID=1812935 RepID=UPI001330378F|nr:nuclear transport factor 2 family protein [Enterobacter roggenkampii]